MTVLVGINGSGKTNFLRAFELLRAGMEGKMREKLSEWGSVETILHKGKINWEINCQELRNCLVKTQRSLNQAQDLNNYGVFLAPILFEKIETYLFGS